MHLFSLLVVCVTFWCVIVESGRSFDGSGYNAVNPSMGMKNTFYSRRGFAPNYESIPHVRELSNALFRSPDLGIVDLANGLPASYAPDNELGETFLSELWGQGVNHDSNDLLDGPFTDRARFDLSVDDVFYKNETLLGVNINFMTVGRSLNVGGNFLNGVSGWFDQGSVFGSSEEDFIILRTNPYTQQLLNDGLMYLESQYVYIPGAESGPYVDLPGNAWHTQLNNPNSVFPPGTPHTFGDRRGNSNVVISNIQVLLVRNYNRLCLEYREKNPSLSGDEIALLAREKSIAQGASITFNAYLPHILGPNAKVTPYTGYKPEVDGTPSLLFNIMFRKGHFSLKNPQLRKADGCLKHVAWPDTFGNVVDITAFPGLGGIAGIIGANFYNGAAATTSYQQPLDGMANVMIGAATSRVSSVDHQADSGMLDIPVQGQGVPDVVILIMGKMLDLIAVDLYRNYEVGVPPYVDVRDVYWAGNPSKRDIYDTAECPVTREAPGPDPSECFDVVTGGRSELSQRLMSFWSKVADIPALVGVLYEPLLEGSTLSATLAGVIRDEYQRKRDADPWFYQRNSQFSQQEKDEIDEWKLKDLMELNGIPAVAVLQNDVFKMPNQNHDILKCDV